MQEQTQLGEDSGQSPPCSKLEHMFMNDKQSKLCRSSTAQCNDFLKQMQARRSLTTSVDNRPSPSIAAHTSTATATRANSINATGHHLSRLNAPAIGAVRLLQ